MIPEKKQNQEKAIAGKGPADTLLDYDRILCPTCGLQITSRAKDPAYAALLQQNKICKCPPDQTFADGRMSAKFQQLKQAAGATIFSREESAGASAKDASVGLAPGATIGGVYKIIKLLGRGAMGEVYLAKHDTLGKKCALKVIPPDQVTEEGWLRFQLEAKTVSKLNQVNLVRVTDLGVHDGCLPFYAMELVEGKNLAEYLAQNGPMPLDMVLQIFMQVCDGIECAHRGGVLHRDLKPANIMFSTNQSGAVEAKVLDFGLVKLTKNDRNNQSLTTAGDVFGTPYYMSPEQCGGEKLDNRADIYSLGCTMFECLTGRPPFTGHLIAAVLFGQLEGVPPTLASVVGPGKFPQSLESVMARILQKNPDERYQSMTELRTDLELISRGEALKTDHKGTGEKGRSTVPPVSTIKTSEADQRARALGFSDKPLFKISSRNNENIGSADDPMGISAVAKLFMTVVLAVVLVGGVTVYYFYNTAKTTPVARMNVEGLSGGEAAITARKSASSDLSKVQRIFGQISQISNGVTVNDGLAQRVFHFPPVSIGSIRYGAGNGTTVNAKGTVSVPSDARVTLVLSRSFGQYTFSFPDILKKIGPDDISELEVTEPETSTGQDIYTLDIPTDLIRNIAGWKSLTKISFIRCKVPDQAVLALNALTSKIDKFSLRGAIVDGNFVSRIKWLKHLESLDLKTVGNIDPVLESLSTSTALKSLCLDATAPSQVGLKALKTCPNFTLLKMAESDLDAAAFNALCDLTTLESLDLKDCMIPTKSVLQLARLKRLLYLNLDFVKVDEDDFKRLKHLLPLCVIRNTPRPLPQ